MEPMFGLSYRIMAKVEATSDVTGRKYTLHGALMPTGIDTANEPLNLAMPVPEEVWRSVEVDDVLDFMLAFSQSPLGSNVD